MPKNRRSFLKAAGGMSLAMAASSIPAPSGAASFAGPEAAPPPPPPPTTPTPSTSWALELDGRFAGHLAEFSGGTVAGKVTAGGKDGTDKQIVGVAYEDLVFDVNVGLDESFLPWIKQVIEGVAQARPLAILTLDPSYKITWRQAYKDCRIKEVRFPALTTGSRDPASITVRIQAAEIGARERGDGSQHQPTRLPPRWTTFFSLRVDGLETESSVKAVDPIVIKQVLDPDPSGSGQGTSRTEIGDLAMTLMRSRSDRVQEWFDRFVMQGDNGAHMEKTGSLALLNQRNQDIFRLELAGLGIYRWEPVATAAASGGPLMKASLYCERARFRLPPPSSPI